MSHQLQRERRLPEAEASSVNRIYLYHIQCVTQVIDEWNGGYREYINMTSGSSWVVPSSEKNTSPLINSSVALRQMLVSIIMVAGEG